jgi:hypothetical protein
MHFRNLPKHTVQLASDQDMPFGVDVLDLGVIKSVPMFGPRGGQEFSGAFRVGMPAHVQTVGGTAR